MSKDGPPISHSGYRYGGLAAIRSGLPAKATNPRSIAPDAKRALANFAAYRERTKSIGEPLPSTQGISWRRAEVLQKIRELKYQEHVEHPLLIYKDCEIYVRLF